MELIRVAFEILTWLIIARALLSWLPNIPYNPVTKFIYEITEPILLPIQKMLPYNLTPFSPIVAILVLQLVERLVIRFLWGLF